MQQDNTTNPVFCRYSPLPSTPIQQNYASVGKPSPTPPLFGVSLEVPPESSGLTAAEAMSFPAVELFNERAMATLDGSDLAEADIPIALEICRRLDGVPLAIELAAAQVDVFGVRGLAAAHLDDRLAVLTRGRRTALPRQQTLRATIDWSYELLSAPERRLLCRLAIFPAGFELEAAAALMNESDDAPTDIGEDIASLVAKSLVSRDGSTPAGRWRLLETIRAYALEKLAERDEVNETARRHAEFFRDLIVPATTSSVLRISVDDVARFGREIDNVRAALDWSFSPTGDAAIGVALTAAFAPMWLHLLLVVECRERVLDILSPDFNLVAPLERRLHISLGIALTLTLGPVERTRTILAKARQLAESVDDVEAELRMLWAQWSMENILGEYRAAQSTAWFWFGNQGWEYLEIGRFWQILLAAGLIFWFGLLWRAVAPAWRDPERRGLTTFFLIAAAAIPVFYLPALFFGGSTHYTVADTWRFWIIHLWVEGFFELFVTT